MTLVSVIVPVYNVEKYMRKCIDSIINQTYTNLEIILVDDGALDRSGEICDEYAQIDPRIKVLHKKNGGLASARNAGIKIATGEYISYIDSDDWVETEFIEILLRGCQDNNAQMSVCRYRECFDESELKSVEKINTLVWKGKEAVRHRIEDESIYGISTSAWNKLYSTKLIEGMEFPEGKYYEDIVYAIEAMLKSDKVAYTNATLYNYRCNRKGSIMNEGFNARIVTDELPLMLQRNEIIRKYGLENIADLVDRNFCIRVIEVFRQLYNETHIANKEILFNECRKYFEEAYRRCDHSYFNGLDRFKVALFHMNNWLCCNILNLICLAKK